MARIDDTPDLRHNAEAPAPARRLPASRYEVHLEDGSWWEVGWDPPLATFYAQHWGDPAAAEDQEVTDWLGTCPEEYPSVDSLDAALGWVVPEGIRVDLVADRAAFASTLRSRPVRPPAACGRRLRR